MKVHSTRARDKIWKVLNRNRALNLFGIGDLDDSMWHQTEWFVDASEADKDYSAVILLIHSFEPPILNALAIPEDRSSFEHTEELLRATLPLLPNDVYCSVSPGLETILRERYTLSFDETWDRMILTKPELAEAADTTGVELLYEENENELRELFDIAFPEGWFKFNFATNLNFGIRGVNGKWIAAAGVRLYSQTYGVGVVSNVMVHPNYRNRGLAREVTGKVTQELLEHVPTIGLNVVEGNIPAIKCYERLGFSFVMKYRGWDATAK